MKQEHTPDNLLGVCFFRRAERNEGTRKNGSGMPREYNINWRNQDAYKSITGPKCEDPMANNQALIYIKLTIQNENIIVGDFTYFSDVEVASHVTHHYPFYGDKLIIGKFYQIAKGVEFIINGANHVMVGLSTFSFHFFGGWEQQFQA